VPLEHSIYYAGELYPIMRGDIFIGEGAKRAAAAARRKNAPPEPPGGSGRGGAAARPTGRGDAGGPNRGGGRGGGGGGGGGYGHRGGSADSARRQVQGAPARGGVGGACCGVSPERCRGRRESLPPHPPHPNPPGPSQHAPAPAGMSRGGGPNSGAGRAAERAALAELIQLLRSRDLLPTAVFAFSKKHCDSAADALGGLDLTTSAEKHASHVFVERCLSRLAEGDRKLPQVPGACLCVGLWRRQGRGVRGDGS
jgi:antiviral helicase SKI2